MNFKLSLFTILLLMLESLGMSNHVLAAKLDKTQEGGSLVCNYTHSFEGRLSVLQYTESTIVLRNHSDLADATITRIRVWDFNGNQIWDTNINGDPPGNAYKSTLSPHQTSKFKISNIYKEVTGNPTPPSPPEVNGHLIIDYDLSTKGQPLHVASVRHITEGSGGFGPTISKRSGRCRDFTE